ncbi:major facilitator superfamily domain-containing protein [Aspergillus bertholletiae]|uniref:Major facilitator superfamily domain-containing protein n=1 Tax=Aspergillus bertholletiae TaxID=1226010 RepID=A0A5N7BD40_9EURO|nr:major facilitator superfamily domain-containing protein [Aspergillus bertholletiae]
MQSYLQYRRLRHAVHRQLETSSLKMQAAPSDGSETPTSYSLSAETDQKRPEDSEKAPGENGPHSIESLRGIQVKVFSGATGAQPKRFFVVDWEGKHDALSPRNFSLVNRMIATLLVSMLSFAVGAASSITAAVLPQSSEEFHVSKVAGSLVTGMYLFGFATGALFSGPLSEIFGRNMVYLGSLVIFMLFVMASALAPNYRAELIFRFLSGVFGSPPLTCAGGTIADLWSPLEKTLAFPFYAIFSFSGPILAPVISSYMGSSSLGWRWANWIILVMSGAVLAIVLLLQPETYAPLLLKWKAYHFRRATGDSRFVSEMDLSHAEVGAFARIYDALKREFLLTVREPIVILISLYMTVIYIIIFTFFDGYEYIFGEVHGLSQGIVNIIWVAMFVGMMAAACLVPVIYRWTKIEFRQAEAIQDSAHTRPENRLWFAMWGAPAIPIGLLWMGWTDFPHISIWSPIVASTFVGYGTILVFISSYMYVIDVYDIYAASALSFMTVSRYYVAGGMTVVGIPFYRNMGVHYTLTILACISSLMTLVPYMFYRYGPTIRSWSKYATHNGSGASVAY